MYLEARNALTVKLRVAVLFAALAGTWETVSASEGGYSNYIPGFYGDIALAVEPADGLSLRNGVYFIVPRPRVSVRR